MKWSKTTETLYQFSSKKVNLICHRAILGGEWYGSIRIHNGNYSFQVPKVFRKLTDCMEGTVEFAKVILKWTKEWEGGK